MQGQVFRLLPFRPIHSKLLCLFYSSNTRVEVYGRQTSGSSALHKAGRSLADLDSFLNESQSCVGLPAAHVKDGCIVEKLCWDAIQPVSFLLFCGVLQQFSLWYEQKMG